MRLRDEVDLTALRRALPFTRFTLAAPLGVNQAEISRIEHRADVFVRTVRRFVQPMGGDPEIRAVFPDRAGTIATVSFPTERATPAEG